MTNRIPHTRQSGNIAITTLVGIASLFVTITGAVMYKFSTQDDALSAVKVQASGTAQKVDDIDSRLTRIENKLDIILSSRGK